MSKWVLCCGVALTLASILGCGGSDNESDGESTDTGGHDNASGGNGSRSGGDASGGTAQVDNPLDHPEEGPAAGNPDGDSAIPGEAGLEDVSHPDRVVGSGTPESCTSDEVVAAVWAGGVITFDCGPDPVTITMTESAVVSNGSDRTVLDGGGLITLSGGGTRRILYQNTCDRFVGWTSSRCDNQANPELTVQNLTFADGNARYANGSPEGNGVYSGDDQYVEEGGGAIYAQGGRLKIVNSRFFNNHCADLGSDIGGGAVRAFQQYEGQPIYVVNSTFGGMEGYGNSGANGGALASIGVSWTIINSTFSFNAAVGSGASDGNGGNGGAIYNDGNEMTLRVLGTRIEDNTSGAFGSAIFFVSNNHTGEVYIEDSTITNNVAAEIWEPTYPQISNHDDTPIHVTNSTIE